MRPSHRASGQQVSTGQQGNFHSEILISNKKPPTEELLSSQEIHFLENKHKMGLISAHVNHPQKQAFLSFQMLQNLWTILVAEKPWLPQNLQHWY